MTFKRKGKKGGSKKKKKYKIEQNNSVLKILKREDIINQEKLIKD